MVNEDHQQDFDEFDNLVDDHAESIDDDLGYQDDGGRKKRQAMFYVVLLVILLVGAGGVWFMFLREPDMPLPMPPQQPPVAENTLPGGEPLPPGVSPDQTAQETGMDQPMPPAADADLPPAAADAPATADMDAALPPAAETPAGDGATTAEALPPPADMPLTPTAEAPAADAAPAMPSPTGDQAAVMPPATPEAPAEATPEAMPEAVPAPSAPETAPTASVDTSAMEKRLVEMDEKIQTLSNELVATKSAMPAAASGDAVSNDQIKALTSKLDKLASQVEALDQRTATLATELQDRANRPAPAIVKPKAVSTPKAAAPVTRKPAATSAAGWELRSAQPGVAWLGRLGSSEMNRYAVGENVPGLGRVQQVSQEGGRWIVKTTGGTLRQ